LDIIVILALILLAGADAFFYVRLRKMNELQRANPLLFTFLPFLVYMLFVWIFSLQILWYILLFGIAAQFIQSFFGYYLDKFILSSRFDRYMHAFGSFAYALLAWYTLAEVINGEISRIYSAILAGAIGMTLGVLVEIAEFITDTRGKSAVNHQKSLRDTDFDLIFNTIGSTCAAVFAYLILR
jgi:hypothetical protein